MSKNEVLFNKSLLEVFSKDDFDYMLILPSKSEVEEWNLPLSKVFKELHKKGNDFTKKFHVVMWAN